MLFRSDSGGCELIKSGNQYQTKGLLTEGLNDQLLRMRSDQAGYSWLHKDQLPFEHKSLENSQLQLFSEQYHIVLMLRLKASGSGNMDLFYLFFREDQSNFGISRLQGTLDTTRKALVGSLVFRFAALYYQSINGIEASFLEFTNVTKRLLAQNNQHPNRSEFRNWILEWASEYLNALGQMENISLKLSENALNKLVDCGDYSLSSEALKKGARYAIMLHSGIKSGDVIIEDSFLLIEPKLKPVNEKDIQHSASPGRLNKTILFLDKLEKAAHKLVNGGNDITSYGVGQSMDRPISAPAITDALRKNQRRVILLLEQHPNRWPLIRHQFRPLLNIVDKREELRDIG